MRDLNYFVADVHLGLQVLDPAEREKRFLTFLEGIPTEQTEALYLLGDIWDFWYEWKYTVPKGYVRIFAALLHLMDSGVKVYFFRGNHDIWCYSYFEELGMIRLDQPAFVNIGDKIFCLGHGDALGKTDLGFRFLRSIFHSRTAQKAFSALVHPTLAMELGNLWSNNNRLKRPQYVWKGEEEPLYKYAQSILRERPVDYFIFGHLHVDAQDVVFTKTSSGPRTARLIILDSWLYKDSPFLFNSSDSRNVDISGW